MADNTATNNGRANAEPSRSNSHYGFGPQEEWNSNEAFVSGSGHASQKKKGRFRVVPKRLAGVFWKGEENVAEPTIEDRRRACKRAVSGLSKVDPAAVAEIEGYIGALEGEQSHLHQLLLVVHSGLMSLPIGDESLDGDIVQEKVERAFHGFVDNFNRLWTEKETLKRNHTKLSQAHENLQERFQSGSEAYDRLREDHSAELQRKDREYTEARRAAESSYEFTLQEQRTKYEGHINSLKSSYERDIREKDRLYSTTLESEREAHKGELRDVKANHEEKLRGVKANHEEKLRGENVKHQVLLNQFFAPVGSFRPKLDNEYCKNFQELQKEVKDLSSQTTLEQSAQHLGAQFGQTRFTSTKRPQKELKLVVEQALWAALLRDVYSTPFQVLGPDAGTFSDIWRKLHPEKQSGKSSNPTWPKASSTSEKFRYAVMESFCGAAGIDSNYGPTNREVQRNYNSKQDEVSRHLQEVVSQVSSVNGDTTARSQRIAGLACSLAVDMGKERSRMQMFTFEAGAELNSLGEKDVFDRNGRNEVNLASVHGVVELPVSPGLSRLGDAHGERLNDLVQNLSPAHIFLATK